MKKTLISVLIPAILIIFYISGPRYHTPQLDRSLPVIKISGDSLKKYVTGEESRVPDLKGDNEARIIWAHDSLKDKTPYSVVYLHGFSASQGEGIPVHTDFARRYGCNLYLSRLYGHGIHSSHALEDMTPDSLLNSAKKAIAIGKQVGEKVILMSTSTGGTLSLYLAGGDPDIAGLILYSPNIKINNPFVFLVTGPWGLQIGRMVAGSDNLVYPAKSREDSLYWDKSYRVEAVVYLQSLLEQTMQKKVFSSVTQPVFLGYYYKDKDHQDRTCRVDAMLDMFGRLGTPENEKVALAFPEAGDHVIACQYKSGDWKGVEKATFDFAENVLKLKVVE